MEENLFSALEVESAKRKEEAMRYPKKRYLYDTLRNVPEGYFTGVYGLRGIGKTILLLQLANETKGSFYFSADSAYVRDFSLLDIVRYAVSKGYKDIFIDEIHYKKDWQQDLKTIYDQGEARIRFSGSSAIEIKKGADLSRRALLYHLKPLSLREYLLIKKNLDPGPAIPPEDLFDSRKRKEALIRTARFADLLPEYYERGGLLYSSDDREYYFKSLESTLERIIHSDLEYLRAIDLNMESMIYKTLEWIAISPVGEVNYTSISSRIGLSKPALIRMIGDLVKLGLVKRVLPCGKDRVRKEPKLFLSFPFRDHINRTVLRKADIGSLREEFVVNHIADTCYMKGSRGEKTPDFLFEGKVLEVGGAGKGFYQNPDFIIKDGIASEEKTIPLYLLGFIY